MHTHILEMHSQNTCAHDTQAHKHTCAHAQTHVYSYAYKIVYLFCVFYVCMCF